MHGRNANCMKTRTCGHIVFKTPGLRFSISVYFELYSLKEEYNIFNSIKVRKVCLNKDASCSMRVSQSLHSYRHSSEVLSGKAS